MTNLVAGILTTMEHWLERTSDSPLQQFALGRDAVSQLVAVLKAPPHEPKATRGTYFESNAEAPPLILKCKHCGGDTFSGRVGGPDATGLSCDRCGEHI